MVIVWTLGAVVLGIAAAAGLAWGWWAFATVLLASVVTSWLIYMGARL